MSGEMHTADSRPRLGLQVTTPNFFFVFHSQGMEFWYARGTVSMQFIITGTEKTSEYQYINLNMNI